MRIPIYFFVLLLGVVSCEDLENRTRIKAVNWTLVTSADDFSTDDYSTIEANIQEFNAALLYDSTVHLGIAFYYDIEFYSDGTMKQGPKYNPKGIDGTEQILSKISIGNINAHHEEGRDFFSNYVKYTYDSTDVVTGTLFPTLEDYIFEFNLNPGLASGVNEESNELQIVWLGRVVEVLDQVDTDSLVVKFNFDGKDIKSKHPSLDELMRY